MDRNSDSDRDQRASKAMLIAMVIAMVIVVAAIVAVSIYANALPQRRSNLPAETADATTLRALSGVPFFRITLPNKGLSQR